MIWVSAIWIDHSRGKRKVGGRGVNQKWTHVKIGVVGRFSEDFILEKLTVSTLSLPALGKICLGNKKLQTSIVDQVQKLSSKQNFRMKSLLKLMLR